MYASRESAPQKTENLPLVGRRAAEQFERNERTAKVRPRLLACLDETPYAKNVGAHAVAIAGSLALEVVLARVLPESRSSGIPADPIAWQLRQHSHRKALQELANEVGVSPDTAEVLLTGEPADELIDWADTNGAALMALATHRNCNRTGLGSTALHILDHGTVSLLLVPPRHEQPVARYKRIVVPIDGSARAESVLPVALRIARTHNSQLVLCHVVPRLSGLNAFSLGSSSELSAEIERQNERHARESLEQLRLRAMEDGIDVQVRMLGPDDPRHALCRMSHELEADLVIISSHGATALSDIPCGSVAEYLASHCPMPVLMVRPNLVTGLRQDTCDSEGQSVFRFG